MMRRRRPLARAAMVGGTAYVAGKAGAKAGAAQAQQQAPAQEAVSAPPAAPPSGGLSQDSMEQLQKLAELHEQGILTDAEFEVQKQKILQGM